MEISNNNDNDATPTCLKSVTRSKSVSVKLYDIEYTTWLQFARNNPTLIPSGKVSELIRCAVKEYLK